MAREHAGHYAAKHSPGTRVAPAIEEAVRKKVHDNRITCRDAHDIAASLGVDVRDVGICIDLMEVRLSNCQLGLFGHGRDRNKGTPPDEVDPALKTAIERALVDGRLSCAEAWRIADESGLPRPDVAKACNAMKLKVNKCQLGAF